MLVVMGPVIFDVEDTQFLVVYFLSFFSHSYLIFVQVDWDYTWESLNGPPRIVDKGIFLSTGEQKKKVLGLFSHGESGKVILIQGKDQKEVSGLVFVSFLPCFVVKDFKLPAKICYTKKNSSATRSKYIQSS
jgi:hypothetical protein